MPLTCILKNPSSTRRIDATLTLDEDWAKIHRVKPRPALACPECELTMHAKQSKLGLRFFAHDHANPECGLNGETPQHRYLKSALAQMIRSHPGWEAIVEAEPSASDHGGWRADVLAVSSTDKPRIAFEVQLAAMTAAVGLERADLYKQDGVESVWLSDLKLPSWLGHVPAVILNHKRGRLLQVPPDELRVAYGIVAREPPRPEWEWLEEDYKDHRVPRLSDVVGGILKRRYKPRHLYGTTVLSANGSTVCRLTALRETPCTENVTTRPCPLHGSPRAIRQLRKAAGLRAWGWDEGRYWREWRHDADKRELQPRGY